jgi:hypothetical protein
MSRWLAVPLGILLLALPLSHLTAQDESAKGRQRQARKSLLEVLDRDGDGVLSREEIKAAAAVLQALDRNGDGRLSRDEMRPRKGRSDSGRSRPDGGGRDRQRTTSAGGTESLHAGKLLLGRPTATSVTINILSDEDLDAWLDCGRSRGSYKAKAKQVRLEARIPVEVVLDKLEPNTRYYYRMRYRFPGADRISEGKEFTFHTQRAPGSPFTFTIQADSHLGTAKHCNEDLYRRTLLNARADQPDFHIDLGDTFRATKVKAPSYKSISSLHIAQRDFFGLLCHSSPLFLVIGNHEAEMAGFKDGTPDNMAVWATRARKEYYPNPFPDIFYSGCDTPEEFVGLRESYYAWEWGDALFVVLDPWWFSTAEGQDMDFEGKSRKEMWDCTLGEEQYRWFKRTLEESKARFKLVFSHHVIGTCRGAVEWVDYYEWGGKSRNGRFEFDDRRPGWEMPIHHLMKENGVTIFFQGHDHLFARQECDGIVYQTCPMPGDFTYSAYNAESYRSGKTLPNSGHLRVTVSPSEVKVDYVRAFLSADETEDHKNGEIAYSYSCQ